MILSNIIWLRYSKMGLGKSKAYSQNFLTDKVLADRLISTSNIDKNDVVYDIGAGNGILTELLADRSKEVVAIEIDHDFLLALNEISSTHPNVTVVNRNVVNFNFLDGPYKIFANIPFRYTSRILKKLYFESPFAPQTAYFFIQKEAFEKYSGFKRETQLSLLLKPFYEFKIIDEIKDVSFRPKPKVEIVFVKVETKQIPDVTIQMREIYQDFIVYCTTRWKPDITKSLAKLFTYQQIKKLSINNSFDMHCNPLDLKYYQWLELFNYFLTDNVVLSKKILIKGSFSLQSITQKCIRKIYRNREKLQKTHRI